MRRTLAAQPNTIVVLIHGNSLSSALLASEAPAVLAAWFPGAPLAPQPRRRARV